MEGKIINIEQVKKGDYFKVLRKPDITTLENGEMQICPARADKVERYAVQVAVGYNRWIQLGHNAKNKGAYEYHKFDDVNHFGHKQKGTKVLVDFTF